MKLKPCPFCGTTDSLDINQPISEDSDLDILYRHERNDGEFWYIHCGKCQTDGPEAMSDHQAELKWNKRI